MGILKFATGSGLHDIWENMEVFLQFSFFFGRENTFFVVIVGNLESQFLLYMLPDSLSTLCCWWFLIEVFRTV